MGESEIYIFRTLFYQPPMNGYTEFILECMHSVTTKLRQFLRIIGFAIVCHHKISEWHLLIGHRMEERLQLFRPIITCESPYQFLVFQFPQVGIVCFVREIGYDAAYKDLQGLWDSQFAAINFRPKISVRIEVGKDALFILADRVIELMYQQCDITQGDASVLASTGDEHHFSGTQYLVMEQRATNPCVSCAAKYQVVDIRIIVANRFAYQMAFHYRTGGYVYFSSIFFH